MTWALTRSRLLRRIHFLERQIKIFQEQRQRMDPKRKPRYAPDLRREILTIGALQHWNNCETARQFVLTEGAIRRWRRRIEHDEDPDRLLGPQPWNKHHAIVAWLIRDLKDQLPDLSVRRIAMHIRRARRLAIAEFSVEAVYFFDAGFQSYLAAGSPMQTRLSRAGRRPGRANHSRW